MFRKLTQFKQGSGVELDRNSRMYETFEEAKSAGLHEACMNIVVGVQIRDEDNNLLSSWRDLENYWIDYRKDNGKFIMFWVRILRPLGA